MAARMALTGGPIGRNFMLGAVGIRSDGAIVRSSNGISPSKQRMVHAEYRCCRKLDVGAVLYIARVNARGEWLLAYPCKACIKMMVHKGLVKAYYTIGTKKIGCIEL